MAFFQNCCRRMRISSGRFCPPERCTVPWESYFKFLVKINSIRKFLSLKPAGCGVCCELKQDAGCVGGSRVV